MKVEAICVREVGVTSPEDSLLEAARRMKEREIGTLVVIDELQRPLGILTDRDLAMRGLAEERAPGTPVAELMSNPVVWVRQGTEVEECVERMAQLRIKRMPVVDDHDRLVGMLSLDDALCEALGADAPLTRALRATM